MSDNEMKVKSAATELAWKDDADTSASSKLCKLHECFPRHTVVRGPVLYEL